MIVFCIDFTITNTRCIAINKNLFFCNPTPFFKGIYNIP